MESNFVVGLLLGFVAWPYFWVMVAIIFTGFCGAVVNEHGFRSFFALALVMACLWLRIPDFVHVVTSWLAIPALAAYLMIGVLWARFKWGLLLENLLEAVRTARSSYVARFTPPYDFNESMANQEALNDYTEFMRSRWQYGHGKGYESFNEFHESLAPNVRNYKASITMWMAYWPVTVAWYIVGDLAKAVFDRIYKAISGYFQRVADTKFKQL